MTCFLMVVAALASGFGLGYYVNGHPEDTRDFLTKVKVAIQNLFNREKT